MAVLKGNGQNVKNLEKEASIDQSTTYIDTMGANSSSYSNGSSVGKQNLNSFIDRIPNIAPGSKKILEALKKFTNQQGKAMLAWFEDEFLADLYFEMLRSSNDMIGSKHRMLMRMSCDIVKKMQEMKEKDLLLSEVAGTVMITENTIFAGKSEFGHNKIENIIEFLLEKKVHNDKLADTEKLLTRIQTEVKENANMLKTMKKFFEKKNVMGLYGSILELIKNGEDFKQIIRDANDKGFKSLQVMHDFKFAQTLLQAGISISIDALEHCMDVGDLVTFEGIVATFHTSVGTSIDYTAGGFSFGLHTEDPDDIDGFGISVGADPDASGPAQEISVGCPLSWNGAKKGIVPVQYSIGVTDDYVLPTGLDACVIIYEIKAKDTSGLEPKAFNNKMFRRSGQRRPPDLRDRDRRLPVEPEICEGGDVPDVDELSDGSHTDFDDDKDTSENFVQDGRKTAKDFQYSIVEAIMPSLEAIPVIPSPAMAKLSGNPSSYYSEWDWQDLDTEHWETLGWTEGMWERQRVVPQSAETPFKELSGAEKRAVLQLGFSARTWDAPSCLEAWRSKDPNTFWHSHKWNQMLKAEKRLWKTLGWKQESWDGEKGKPKSYKTKWDDLTDDERLAAIKLGFDEERWYKSSNYFKNDRWFAFKSKVVFTDTNTDRDNSADKRYMWNFSYAEVYLYDLGHKSSRQLDTKTFRDMIEYKQFVLEYCEPSSNTAELMKSQLRPASRKGVIYWEDLFQSYYPGLESFRDVPEGSLDGYDGSTFPNDSPRF